MANYRKKQGAGKAVAIMIAGIVAIILIGLALMWGTGYAITGKANPSQWQASVNTVINGKDGADGKNGADGKDGANGADGQTPHIGENGNWFIGETDTGVKAAGQDGAAGADGKDGQDGQDGQPGTKLYRHSIVAENIGSTGSSVTFVIYSSDSEPYTATTLPQGTIVTGLSWASSEIPLNVHVSADGKAEITFLDISGDKPMTRYYKAETITDTVTEV